MLPLMKQIGIGCAVIAAIALTPAAFAMGHLFSRVKIVHMHAIDASGIGADIGTLTLSDSSGGLTVKPALRSLPPGDHGFHIHAKGDCGAADKDGVMTAGLAAGGHFDPDNTGKHEGPTGMGHMGDMPLLVVAADGTATTAIVVPRMSLAKAEGHAIVIHEGGDNYSDTPKPLGGGGARIACGVAE